MEKSKVPFSFSIYFISSPFPLIAVDDVIKFDKEQDKKLKEDALNRLSQDISTVDDDYLDLTLQKEESFLKRYLSLLEKD